MNALYWCPPVYLGRVASAILFFNEKDRICMWNVVDIEKIMQTIPTELEASELKENYL